MQPALILATLDELSIFYLKGLRIYSALNSFNRDVYCHDNDLNCLSCINIYVFLIAFNIYSNNFNNCALCLRCRTQDAFKAMHRPMLVINSNNNISVLLHFFNFAIISINRFLSSSNILIIVCALCSFLHLCFLQQFVGYATNCGDYANA